MHPDMQGDLREQIRSGNWLFQNPWQKSDRRAGEGVSAIQRIDAEFRNIAWLIGRHESRQRANEARTRWFHYNQFNSYGATEEGKKLIGLPNKTAGNNPDGTPRDGWGIMQIDQKSYGKDKNGNKIPVPTNVVWDWKANVARANEILREKKAEYQVITNAYRKAFGPSGLVVPPKPWIEPPVNWPSIDGVTFTTFEWSVMTLYNGKGGCPTRKLPGYVNPITKDIFQSPLWFEEKEGKWHIKPNKENYNGKIIRDINKSDVVVE